MKKAVRRNYVRGIDAEFEKEIDLCRKLLNGTGLTLIQAVQRGVRLSVQSGDASIGEMVKRFLVNRKSTRANRTRTIDEYRCQLGKFAKDFGQRSASSISPTEIEEWLLAPHLDTRGRRLTWAGGRRNVTRGYLSTLFNFGSRKSLCTTNPVTGVDKAIVERTPVEVWTPAEAVSILTVADRECSEVMRFLVLALFSGVRTAELFELQTEHVKLDQLIITIPASISKTRKIRNIPISENLAAWLKNIHSRAQPDRIWSMGESSLHRRYRLIEKGTGLNWRRNAMRHSYASNHLALHDNECLTSRACGSTPPMLREHYDAVVSRANADAYFGILPSSIGS